MRLNRCRSRIMRWGALMIGVLPGAAALLAQEGTPDPLAAGQSYVQQETEAAVQGAPQLPVGFAFRYPQGWTLEPTRLGLGLVPADIKGTEVYLVSPGPEAAGVERPDDPRVIEFMEENLIGRLFEQVERTGQIRVYRAAGRDHAAADWQGVTAAGVGLHARLYLTFIRERAYFLLALSERERLDARDRVLRAVAASFRFGGQPAPGAANPLAPTAPTPANPLAAADPWAGAYAGENITLRLQGGDGRYTGTLQFQGQEFPVSARAQGDGLAGAFESQGATFEFTASLQGNTLMVSSDGATYRLERQGGAPAAPANPLAGEPAAAGPSQERQHLPAPVRLHVRLPDRLDPQGGGGRRAAAAARRGVERAGTD